MLEPEDPPICECRYDEARDEMDRDDCPFHGNLVDDELVVPEVESDPARIEDPPMERKQVAAASRKHEAA